MIVTDKEGWIDQIQKLEALATPPTTGAFRMVRDVQPLKVGDVVADAQLINQFGQPIRLSQFRGQALAITFIFTRCPFPTFCPLTANHFAEAQQKLLALPHAPTNWHLLTVSFDPAFDKPAVLKAYAQGYQYDPDHWSFATGELIDITALADQFGCVFWHDESGSLSHNLRTAVVDPMGRVQRIFPGNGWTSDDLVTVLLKVATQK